MGSATLDSLRSMLPSNSLQRLRCFKFILGSPAERMDAVVKSILVKPCSGFKIGHEVAVFMRHYFLRQDGTLISFIRALKIACLQHFLTEPLSLILRWLNSGDKDEVADLLPKAMYMYAAGLPSVRESGIPEMNNKILSDGLLELERLQKGWSTVLLCLYEVGKNNQIQLLDLLCEALDLDLYHLRASLLCSPKEKDSETLSSIDNVMCRRSHGKGSFIYLAIRKVRELPQRLLHQLLTSWEKLTKDVQEVNEKVMELKSSLNIEYGKVLDEDETNVLTNKSRSHLSVPKDSRLLNERAATMLETMVRDYLGPIGCMPFHEAVCFKNVGKLQSALIGDARKMIQVDLLEFHKIIRCCCCSGRGNAILPSMHDTSILYVLAQEHGDLINLHDWYQSFKSVVLQTITKQKNKSKMSPSPRKRKHMRESQNQSEATLQARFCRAVMELQITGLLRMPTKRRPDFVQRVAFGL